MMSRMSSYVLRQLIQPILLFTFLLTTVIWLSQSLRLLDLVINRGQSAVTFVYLTVMMLPQLLVIILPVAFFGGVLYGLHRLNVDSELVVMSAAGHSRAQLAVPVLLAAGFVMVLTYICALYFMPWGQRNMHAEVMSIRADIATALLSEGNFNAPVKGLTVFIRELDPGQVLLLETTDPGSIPDVAAWSKSAGHPILSQDKVGPVMRFWIQKA